MRNVNDIIGSYGTINHSCPFEIDKIFGKKIEEGEHVEIDHKLCQWNQKIAQ